MAAIHTSVPDGLIPLLESHLPHSLPILRRLQFTRFPGGQRPTARIILAGDAPVSDAPHNFAAAYLDFGSGIETSLFMYSTLEDSSVSAEDREVCEAQIGAVVDAVKAVAREQPEHRGKTLLTFPSLVLKLEDGTPIAWSFLGTDASLSSLHCEEPYRKRGYAKALAAKLFKRSTFENLLVLDDEK
ncbi:hypothetical protein K4K57_000575 [Colletotrichum sp. SAR 10_99]|nr:hypothetical protein K4K55_000138 [Colletotrichum sp. SAR 10_96]KAI8296482.1 hypothetical protein K4K56_003689 [Colletotrichum sp. SAR 10_98]KAJ5019409.1 hypothetical protein K4K57_000575 [Colletotrichum sp. SAR 10_99]